MGMKFLVLASSVLAAVSGFYHAPYANAANVPVPCAAGVYGHHFYGKRDADAGVYAAVPFGSSTGLDPITQGVDPVTQGYALPYAAHYGGKREAEADAQVVLPYAGYAGYGYAAPHAVAATYGGLVHSSHVGVCTNYVGAQVPC